MPKIDVLERMEPTEIVEFPPSQPVPEYQVLAEVEFLDECGLHEEAARYLEYHLRFCTRH